MSSLEYQGKQVDIPRALSFNNEALNSNFIEQKSNYISSICKGFIQGRREKQKKRRRKSVSYNVDLNAKNGKQLLSQECVHSVHTTRTELGPPVS